MLNASLDHKKKKNNNSITNKNSENSFNEFSTIVQEQNNSFSQSDFSIALENRENFSKGN